MARKNKRVTKRTKTVKGKTYTLNKASRWQRADKEINTFARKSVRNQSKIRKLLGAGSAAGGLAIAGAIGGALTDGLMMPGKARYRATNALLGASIAGFAGMVGFYTAAGIVNAGANKHFRKAERLTRDRSSDVNTKKALKAVAREERKQDRESVGKYKRKYKKRYA